MLNITAAPQAKSSADNPIAISDFVSGNAQEPETGEFAKILQHEISETAGKREANNAATALADSGTDLANITDTSDINSLINNPFTEAANTYPANQPFFPAGPPSNPNTLMAMATTMPTTAGAAILPTALSTTPLQIPLISQDNKQFIDSTLPANQMLQQRFAQSVPVAANFAYSPDSIWQSLNMADSAAFGNFLPRSTEMNEAVRINTGEPIFSAPNEPISTHAFSLSNTASATSLNATPQNVQVDLPVGQPKWDGEFAQKIVWLTTQQHQIAEIHLNPVHLGPVEVMLSITEDQATAQFLSPHPAVREAIEEALPRLREMMAENGIQLGNVMVGADSFQQENKQHQAYNPVKDATSTIGAKTETIGQTEATASPSKHHGIVNTYA